MEIKLSKSSLACPRVMPFHQNTTRSILPFKAIPFDSGIKYLSFDMKPDNYCVQDWQWLLNKIHKRAIIWCKLFWRPPLFTGTQTLVKAVLEATLVYWHSLTYIPKAILNKIRKMCFRFL
jgi:hypothetical protein